MAHGEYTFSAEADNVKCSLTFTFETSDNDSGRAIVAITNDSGPQLKFTTPDGQFTAKYLELSVDGDAQRKNIIEGFKYLANKLEEDL